MSIIHEELKAIFTKKNKLDIFKTLCQSAFEIVDEIELENEEKDSIEYSPFTEIIGNNNSIKKCVIATDLFNLIKKLECSKSVLIGGFIYFERLLLKNSNIISKNSIQL